MEEEIRKQYEIETGKKWFTVPFTHGEQAFASWGYQLWLEKKISQVEPEVKPDACGGWRKEKPNKPCYFIHRYNRKDNNPSLFEAVIDGGVLVVANIQDDEFVETMEDFSDGDFFIIEKY